MRKLRYVVAGFLLAISLIGKTVSYVAKGLAVRVLPEKIKDVAVVYEHSRVLRGMVWVKNKAREWMNSGYGR